ALAVERTGSKTANHGAVVNESNSGFRNLLTQLSSKKRCPAVHRVSIYTFEDVLENRRRHQRIEDHRHFLRLHLARSQSAEGAFCSHLTNMLGGFEPSQTTRNRIPIVALHGASFLLCNRNRGNRTIRAAILTQETVGI